MNLKTNKMSKYKFYFDDDDTVGYYADYQDANGWAGTALEIYKFVADECEWHNESDMRVLYLDLLEQVEDKIREQL